MLTIVTSLLNAMCSVRVFEAFKMIFIWCTLILGQLSERVGGLDGGEGWKVGQIFLTICLEKPPKKVPQDQGGV